MKRTLLCLLAALLLTSCQSGGPEETVPADTDTQNPEAVETAPAETETGVDDLFAIEKEDNGGADFTVLTTQEHNYEFEAVELTGDVVNDAVFQRNSQVEELLGIRLDFVFRPGNWEARGEYTGLITSAVMAGDSVYDLTAGMISCMQPIASTQIFRNAHDLQYMNMDNPWWATELQEALTVNGIMLGFIGDMSTSMYSGLTVMFANLDIIGERQMENPYELVRNGEWTFDKFISVCTDTGQDLNGDDTFTMGDDLYGLVTYGGVAGSFQACMDLHAVGIGEDGLPVVNELTDQFADAADRLTALARTKGFHNGADNTCDEFFIADKIIYLGGKLNCVEKFRDMDSDFAIIPFPKYDQSQENHLSQIATATQMSYVPVTAANPDLTGKVCEALCFYSYKDVVPAYYETTLQGKYSRDPDTQEMLTIIRAGATLPFECAYMTTIDGDPWCNQLMIQAALRDKPVASLLASGRRVWESNIQKILEAYE